MRMNQVLARIGYELPREESLDAIEPSLDIPVEKIPYTVGVDWGLTESRTFVITPQFLEATDHFRNMRRELDQVHYHIESLRASWRETQDTASVMRDRMRFMMGCIVVLVSLIFVIIR